MNRCKNCGREFPGKGADMYVCPADNSGHCDFREFATEGLNTTRAYTSLTQKAKAEQQAEYDYWYNKRMNQLNDN